MSFSTYANSYFKQKKNGWYNYTGWLFLSQGAGYTIRYDWKFKKSTTVFIIYVYYEHTMFVI